MRKLLLAALVMSVAWNSYAQNQLFCDTEPVYATKDTADIPWYGNNEILFKTLDEHPEMLITPADKSKALDDCADINKAINIPVQFWIWRENEADNPISNLQIQILLDNVNVGFQSNGLNFRFYQNCAAQFLVNPYKVAFGSNSEFNQLNNNGAHLPSTINIHVVRENLNDVNWRGRYGGFLNDFIALHRNAVAASDNGATLIHELGHYFGLDHTHQFTEIQGCCSAEPVTRGLASGPRCFRCVTIPLTNILTVRCSITGDMLCDTPADPLSTVSDYPCSYLDQGWTDEFGQLYTPDVTNYMSYYSCQSSFSNGQKGIILGNVLKHPLRSFILSNDDNQTIEPDTYEPDNTDGPDEPRLISIGHRQCRSMHNSSFNLGCNDQEDWLRIENENGIVGGYRLIITDVNGVNNPVDDIIIHNTNNQGERTNQLAPQFIDNGFERIWEIPCGSMTPNTQTIDPYDFNDFYVQVIRNNNAPGFYQIELKPLGKLPRLTNALQACVGSEYHVTILPPGATVSWTSSYLTISNTSGPNTTITAIQQAIPPGQLYSIEALITDGSCSYRLEREFAEIGASTLPYIGPITMDVSGSACEPQFKFSVPALEDGIYYDWQCSATISDGVFYGCYGDVVQSTYNGLAYTYANAMLDSPSDVTINVTLTVSNDCNIETTKTQGFLYRPDDCGDHIRTVRIIPNPVNGGSFTLEIDDDTINPEPYQIIIVNQFGSLQYMITSPDKSHTISAHNFSSGLYYAEVISNLEMVTTTFYIQH